LKGAAIAAPDADSITSVMMRAALREAGLAEADVKLNYTRFQDAVPFFVENGFAQAGVTASGTVVKAWTAKGGRVLLKARAVPIKEVLASPNLSAEQIKQVREFLLALDATEDGRARLEPSKLTGFDRFDEAALLNLGGWLGL
jgi:ABC-type phosphate/phosphonate transport system substrate-binding protein